MLANIPSVYQSDQGGASGIFHRFFLHLRPSVAVEWKLITRIKYINYYIKIP